MANIKINVSDRDLISLLDELKQKYPNRAIRSWIVQAELQARYGINVDASTIRGKYIELGIPLSQTGMPTTNDTVTALPEIVPEQVDIPDELKSYMLKDEEFANYVERPIDNMLMVAYDSGLHPITQGKQGTGKTFSHKWYAYKKKLPFFLFSCYTDMKLQKLYGSPTIENGTMKFNESILVKATQSPSVILFDEINAVENKSTFDWHALLENRELYIKDKGQAYKLHPKCRIGFAQNPRSAKYIGGNVLASNFLGRCVFLTYPEFNKRELKKALSKAFPSLSQEETEQFIVYYQSLLDVIDRASLPIDISIRQLMHTVKLYKAGIGLKQSLELGIINMLDSVSQPTVKESLHKLAIGIWQELLNKEKQQQNPATVEWLVWNTIWRHTNE